LASRLGKATRSLCGCIRVDLALAAARGLVELLREVVVLQQLEDESEPVDGERATVLLLRRRTTFHHVVAAAVRRPVPRRLVSSRVRRRLATVLQRVLL